MCSLTNEPRKQANRGKTRAGAGSTATDAAASVGGKSIGNTATSVTGGADKGLESPSKGIEFEAWQPEEEAPLMSFDESQLVMQIDKGGSAESMLSCMNVGNCAVYYSWSRQQVLYLSICIYLSIYIPPSLLVRVLCERASE